MKKIVVTAVGGDIGYAIVKALKVSNHDLYIIGCDIKKYNVSYDIVDEFYVCPPYGDIDAWVQYMRNIITSNEVSYFWPVTESEIKIVNEKLRYFSNVKVVINQANILNIAMDKGETARFLYENGVLTPKTWEDIFNHEIICPVIVKEKFGCGSHSVVLANDKDELAHYYNEMENPIVQEYVGDKTREYTMTVFSDGDVVNSIVFKRELGFGGMSRYVELVHDEKFSDMANKIAKMFNLHGSINIQMRNVGNDYYVFEINPRISSTMGFRMQLGFNDVSWWIDIFEKKKVEKYIAPKGIVYGVRSVEEKIYVE